MSEDTEEDRTETRFFLMRAAVHADLEEARRFLENDATLIHDKNLMGETALHFLAVENELDAVKFLAQHGADVNTRNDFGDAPIDDAAELGHVEMVRLLLQLGAKTTAEELREKVDYGVEFGDLNAEMPERILDIFRSFRASEKP